MTIHEIEGDLLYNRVNADVIAQGCNCRGFMGGGPRAIATQIAELYPDEMLRLYKKECDLMRFQLGSAHFYIPPSNVVPFQTDYPTTPTNLDLPILFNLGTQYDFGRDARFTAVYVALGNMKRLLLNTFSSRIDKRYPTLAMPQIGCGIGGLDWIGVDGAIREIFDDYPADVFLYTKFVPNK